MNKTSTAQQAFEEAQNFSPESQPWPELKPLVRELPPPDLFPVEALVPTLAAAVRKAHEVIQAPLAICGMSFLAAANLAVQAHADIEIDGRRNPISLWILSIAESGQRKSGVDTIALAAHRQFEKEQIRKYREEMRAYKARVEASKATKKSTSDTAQMEEDAPLRPLLLVSEPTYEGLSKQLAVGTPTVGLFTDEGARFLGGHAMNRDNQHKSAGGLNSLWDRGEVDRSRSGDGSDKHYGKRAALHLMIQPRASSLLLANRDLEDQGFVARFLVVFPASFSGRQYQRCNLSKQPEIMAYHNAADQILRRPLPLVPESRNELEPPVISLSDASYQLYVSFHNELQAAAERGGKFYEVRSFAHKAHDHAARIAATFALFESIEAPEVRAEHMRSAVKITRYCLGELTRLIGVPSVDQSLQDAQDLLEFMQRKGRSHYCEVELQQLGQNRLRSAAKVSSTLATLAAHGWVRPSTGLK